MPTTALKEALKNCLINFDRRITATDLVQQYKLSYEEVHQTLKEYLLQQESKGVKYEKRFLVHGLEKDNQNEVYTVVRGEKKLQEWLERLQKAQAALYSVEVVGGSKSAPCIFKAVEWHSTKLQNLKTREVQSKVIEVSNQEKPKAKKSASPNTSLEQTTTAASTSKAAAALKIKSEKTETSPPEARKTSKKPSPEDKKKNSTAAAGRKAGGIGNYFSAASTTSTKKDEIKKEPQQNRSPKKMQDFFKKQAEKPKTAIKEESTKKKSPIKSEDIKTKVNTSVQLFDEESTDASSDEEAKLDALKRDIISSDHEVDATEEATSSSKRRRIIDSDDEESAKPPEKIERKESDAAEEVTTIEDDDEPKPMQQQSETYLDEDGFVITVKSRKPGGRNSNAKANSRTTKSSPRKSSPPSGLTKTAAAAKTKQGNIMNFFSKK